MTLLVFGSSGQVASELRRHAPEARFLGRNEADLTDPQACANAVREMAPSAVINAAAYTAVDRAEDEEALAQIINADSPAAIARACAALNVPLVQVSTDYVFDGSGHAPWRPRDPVAPQNAYGRSKLRGENAVRAAGGPFAILRTSWVFSSHGANFVKTMLRLGESRDSLNIVDDQIGGPTAAEDIAVACLQIARQLVLVPAKSGIYHFSGAPDTSWKAFAQTIFAQADRPVTVTGIPTSDYPTPARRPLNSRLDCSGTETVFGLHRPDWQSALTRVLKELKESS